MNRYHVPIMLEVVAPSPEDALDRAKHTTFVAADRACPPSLAYVAGFSLDGILAEDVVEVVAEDLRVTPLTLLAMVIVALTSSAVTAVILQIANG